MYFFLTLLQKREGNENTTAVRDFILKMEYYATWLLLRMQGGAVARGIEVAGNSWLSGTSFLSFFYLIVEKNSEEKATCNFST
jgi:hypothetical protein